MTLSVALLKIQKKKKTYQEVMRVEEACLDWVLRFDLSEIHLMCDPTRARLTTATETQSPNYASRRLTNSKDSFAEMLSSLFHLWACDAAVGEGSSRMAAHRIQVSDDSL